MSITLDRLAFIKSGKTITEMAKSSMIPRSTLSYVLRGLRKLPDKYITNVRNYYYRDTWARLRSAGLPTHQVRRFYQSNPSNVTEILYTVNDTVTKLRDDKIERYESRYQRELKGTELEEMKLKYEDSIRAGMKVADTTIEEWSDY